MQHTQLTHLMFSSAAALSCLLSEMCSLPSKDAGTELSKEDVVEVTDLVLIESSNLLAVSGQVEAEELNTSREE